MPPADKEKALRTAFLSVTMKPSDRARVSIAAERDGRSVSAWVERLIVAELDRLDAERKKKKPG
jgi:predicted HicB family RNase H-like nuclease